MRRIARETGGLFGETLHRCVLHSTDTQSAALAIYSLLALLKRRVVSFTLVLAAGLLLLLSLAFRAGLMALTDLLAARRPFPVALIRVTGPARNVLGERR